MYRTILTTTLLALMLSGQADAQEGENATIDYRALQGPVIGVTAGALLAGPPGILLGLIGGSLIGHIEQQQTQIEVLGEQQARQQAKILEQWHKDQLQLNAITGGFSFCLRFRSDSAEIEPAIHAHLDALAGMLNAFPQMDIELLAATDRRGSEAYNRNLARHRAQTVARRLVAAGVSSQRIKTIIAGEQRARYPLQDPEGLGFDRYVVLSLRVGEQS